MEKGKKKGRVGMEISLTNALKPFSRAEEVEVDCGGGWFISVRQAAVHNQGFRAAVLKYKTGDKSLINNRGLTGYDDTDYKFFCENMITGWRGLVDDSKNTVEFTPLIAEEIFKSSNQGKVLFHKLLGISINDSMFEYDKETKNS